MRNVGTVPNKLNDGQILFLRSFLLILLFVLISTCSTILPNSILFDRFAQSSARLTTSLSIKTSLSVTFMVVLALTSGGTQCAMLARFQIN